MDLNQRPKKYKIEEDGIDAGFGSFHLYCDGDWLESFQTRDAAETELKNRQQFDQVRR